MALRPEVGSLFSYTLKLTENSKNEQQNYFKYIISTLTKLIKYF